MTASKRSKGRTFSGSRRIRSSAGGADVVLDPVDFVVLPANRGRQRPSILTIASMLSRSIAAFPHAGNVESTSTGGSPAKETALRAMFTARSPIRSRSLLTSMPR